MILSVAFSPDGKMLASGAIGDTPASSTARTIKLWAVETGKELKTLTGHSGPVFCVAFSPDSKTLASSSPDKAIRLWNIATPLFSSMPDTAL
jgi:WD40 repeat protein